MIAGWDIGRKWVSIACKNLPKLNLDRSWIFAQRWLEEADEFGVMYMALGENFLSFGANILL
jgi:hypothetical protein